MTQRIWQDIDYVAVLVEVDDYYAKFKVYEILYMDGDVPVSSKKSPDPAPSLEEAEAFLTGTVKWDGCCNLDIGDEGYMHFCSREQAGNVGEMLRRLYDWAAEVIPHWDG